MIRIILLAFWLLVGLQAAGQTFVRAPFGDAVVSLVIPKGYCVISRDDVLGRLHYKLQEEGNSGRNKVAILFSDCGEWAKRKADNSYLLRHHGNYLFQLTGGNELLLPTDATRVDLIEVYTNAEIKNSGSNIVRDGITEHLKEKLKAARVPGPSVVGSVNLGMIDRNSEAAFIGVGATLMYPSGPVRFVGVSAATTTRRTPVTINLYGTPETGNPFGKLLAQQKKLVSAFIAANE